MEKLSFYFIHSKQKSSRAEYWFTIKFALALGKKI
jgi:hypothetical protein